MPWDEGLAQLLRDDLAGEPVTEREMFGGIAFMRAGHMVGGIHKGGVMVRVGKPNEAEALSIPGARQMTMTGRAMPGMIALSDEAAADDARRGRLIGMALAFVRGLPPK
ncbi:MAG: TfoX/Sxy family protein [Paracoccaceae bacterium]